MFLVLACAVGYYAYFLRRRNPSFGQHVVVYKHPPPRPPDKPPPKVIPSRSIVLGSHSKKGKIGTLGSASKGDRMPAGVSGVYFPDAVAPDGSRKGAVKVAPAPVDDPNYV